MCWSVAKGLTNRVFEPGKLNQQKPLGGGFVRLRLLGSSFMLKAVATLQQQDFVALDLLDGFVRSFGDSHVVDRPGQIWCLRTAKQAVRLFR